MLKKFNDYYLKKFNDLTENKIVKYIFIFLVFCLVLFFVYHHNISLWADELFSIDRTKKVLSILDVIKHSSIVDSWPPLFYILLHYFQILFGNSEIVLRSFSFIFNILSLFVLYLFTCSLYSKKEAILSCIFFTFSPFILSYGIEVRGYSLFVLLSLLSLYFLMLLIKKEKTSYLFLFFLFAILNSLTHYFGLLLTFFQILYLMIYNLKFISRNKTFFICFLLLVLIYPLIHFNSLYFKNDIFKHNAVFASTTINRNTFILKELFPQMLFNITNINIELSILFLSLFFFFFTRENKSNQFILYFVLAPLISVNLFAYFFMSFLNVRYFIFAFPLVYIMLSHFIVTLTKSYFYIVTFILLIIFCINVPNIKIPDDRETVSLMKNFSKDKIAVLHSECYFIDYYLDMFDIKGYKVIDINVSKKDFNTKDIDKLIKENKYVFLIHPFINEQCNYLFEGNFKITKITDKLYKLSNL